MKNNTQKGKGSILRLIGVVRDKDGNECGRFVKDNDIFLWNFAVIIAQFLKLNFCPTDPTVYSFTDMAGTARTTQSNYFGGYTPQAAASYPDYFNGYWKVQIGGGSDGAAVTDHALQAFLQEVQPTLPEIITDGNILKIAFSSTFAFSAETVVSETAIKGNGAILPAGVSSPYAVTRDTFTAQTVPAGGSITLQHELWFNGTPPAA